MRYFILKNSIVLVFLTCLIYGTGFGNRELPGINQAPSACGLAKWITILKQIFPDISDESFEEVRYSELDLAMSYSRQFNELADSEVLELLESTNEYSPERKYCANMFVQSVFKYENQWLPFQDSPDKYINIFDNDSLIGWQVASAGPSSTFHALGWLSNTELLVIGINPHRTDIHLAAWKIKLNLPKADLRFFLGPTITPVQLKQLSDNWLIWLKEHYTKVDWME